MRKPYRDDNFKEKFHSELLDNGGVIYCPKCGHSVEFQNYFTTKKLCTHCGRYVFRTKKDEYDYRMKEEMRKVK